VILFVFKLVNQNSNGKKKTNRKVDGFGWPKLFLSKKFLFFLGYAQRGEKKKRKKRKKRTKNKPKSFEKRYTSKMKKHGLCSRPLEKIGLNDGSSFSWVGSCAFFWGLY
jgi:hypothetical protein